MANKLASVDDVAGKTFDFVIIGGGVAGCVLANRLSQNPNVSVALLEAGNAHLDDPLVNNPMGWMRQAFNPEYDWVFRTKKQAKVMNGGATPEDEPTPSFYWSRGKGLGGSSALNFMYWTRPQKEEVDALEKLGNGGWNWDRFFETAKRTEAFRESTSMTNDPEFKNLYKEESRGRNGPVSVSFSRTCSGAEGPFHKALAACGIRIIDDGMNGSISGSFKISNIVDPRNGTRCTAASSYLTPVLHRPNLTVLTGAYVNKIVTRKEGGDVVATGVEFEYGGKTYTVNVGKDAILSAGTVKSPHILELSGIGDRSILEPLGIPVQLDLPSVGTNLQDHLIMTKSHYLMKSEKHIVTTDTISTPTIQEHLSKLYGEDSASEWLTFTGVTFASLQDISPRADELISALEQRIAARVASGSLAPGLHEQLQLQLEMLKNKQVPDLEIVIFPFNLKPDGAGKPYIGILPSLGRPFYRGTIHAVSSAPNVQPEIDPNYVEDEFDVELLLESMKFIRKVTQQKEWQDVAEMQLMPSPDIDTDEKLREYIKMGLSTTWHSCGTCSMLPKDKGGVVDTSLKVYGTRNLRVIDLSVLPLITIVHTQGLTYAIAEQAADILIAEHKL